MTIFAQNIFLLCLLTYWLTALARTLLFATSAQFHIIP